MVSEHVEYTESSSADASESGYPGYVVPSESASEKDSTDDGIGEKRISSSRSEVRISLVVSQKDPSSQSSSALSGAMDGPFESESRSWS